MFPLFAVFGEFYGETSPSIQPAWQWVHNEVVKLLIVLQPNYPFRHTLQSCRWAGEQTSTTLATLKTWHGKTHSGGNFQH